MKKTLCNLVGCVVAAMVLAGCGNDAPKLSAKEKSLFDAAEPATKQIWETALAADKANDYLSASTNLQALLSQNLTLDQFMAVQTARKSLNQRISDALAKGDAGAQAAVEWLKTNHSRPGR